jgi:hypothetical protein
VHTKFWLENLEGRDHSEDLGIDRWEHNIKIDMKEIGVSVWTGISWL